MIYHQIFSTQEANNSLKLSFKLNCVLKRANDFKLTHFAFDLVQKFEAIPHEWQSFPNPSDTQQRYNKYLTNLIFLVCTVTYRSLFFPVRFIARALCAWAINQRGKNLVGNLRYRPQTWLVRGMCTASRTLSFQIVFGSDPCTW